MADKDNRKNARDHDEQVEKNGATIPGGGALTPKDVATLQAEMEEQPARKAPCDTAKRNSGWRARLRENENTASTGRGCC